MLTKFLAVSLLSCSFLGEIFPEAEVFSKLEKLGIVGILLLMLFFLTRREKTLVTKTDELAAQHFRFLTELIAALTSLRDSNAELTRTHVSVHDRLDDILRCGAPHCPVKLRPLVDTPPKEDR